MTSIPLNSILDLEHHLTHHTLYQHNITERGLERKNFIQRAVAWLLNYIGYKTNQHIFNEAMAYYCHALQTELNTLDGFHFELLNSYKNDIVKIEQIFDLYIRASHRSESTSTLQYQQIHTYIETFKEQKIAEAKYILQLMNSHWGQPILIAQEDGYNSFLSLSHPDKTTAEAELELQTQYELDWQRQPYFLQKKVVRHTPRRKIYKPTPIKPIPTPATSDEIIDRYVRNIDPKIFKSIANQTSAGLMCQRLSIEEHSIFQAQHMKLAPAIIISHENKNNLSITYAINCIIGQRNEVNHELDPILTFTSELQLNCQTNQLWHTPYTAPKLVKPLNYQDALIMEQIFSRCIPQITPEGSCS